VLGQLLGVSLSEAEGRQLKRWCDDFLLPFGRDIGTLTPDELARIRSAGAGLHEFVDTVLSRHGTVGADDVVSRLLAGESEDRLSEQELFANIVLLLIAGHENSTSLIGNGAAMLLDQPEIRKELEQDPSRWPAAVEELMRLVSPNQFIRRRAREDVVLGEQTIRAGDTVLLIIAAATEIRKRFRTRPVRVQPSADRRARSRDPLLPRCTLGAARRPHRIATMFERWPTIRQTGELEYADNFNVRILRSLPVATS
jgi:cytochrome P450